MPKNEKYYRPSDIIEWSFNHKTGTSFAVVREGAKPITKEEYVKLQKSQGIEPRKKADIEKNLSQKKFVEEQQRNLSDNQKLAKLYHIDLSEHEAINQELLTSQVQGLRDIADEFPQVEKLMLEHYKHGLEVSVESFRKSMLIGGHNSITADADTAPNTGIISLNAESKMFNSSSFDEAVELSLKRGNQTKFGSVQSTSDIRHTIIHEYGHLMQYMLAKKWGIRNSELEGDILTRLGLKEFPKTLSAYANATSISSSEFISEAIAQAFILGKEASKESKLIYNLFKKELG